MLEIELVGAPAREEYWSVDSNARLIAGLTFDRIIVWSTGDGRKVFQARYKDLLSEELQELGEWKTEFSPCNTYLLCTYEIWHKVEGEEHQFRINKFFKVWQLNDWRLVGEYRSSTYLESEPKDVGHLWSPLANYLISWGSRWDRFAMKFYIDFFNLRTRETNRLSLDDEEWVHVKGGILMSDDERYIFSLEENGEYFVLYDSEENLEFDPELQTERLSIKKIEDYTWHNFSIEKENPLVVKQTFDEQQRLIDTGSSYESVEAVFAPSEGTVLGIKDSAGFRFWHGLKAELLCSFSLNKNRKCSFEYYYSSDFSEDTPKTISRILLSSGKFITLHVKIVC